MEYSVVKKVYMMCVLVFEFVLNPYRLLGLNTCVFYCIFKDLSPFSVSISLFTKFILVTRHDILYVSFISIISTCIKAARLGDSIFDRQPEILRTEAVQVNSPSHEEDFDDVGCNADLYASRQDAFQGSSRGSDERSQQQSDPHCFQSLSLD